MTAATELQETTSKLAPLATRGPRLLFTGALAAIAALVGTNGYTGVRSTLTVWTPSEWTSNATSPVLLSERRTAPHPAEALREIRSRASVTWEQLAEVLGVDRRTLHLWAVGRPASPRNIDKLAELLSGVRKVDRGDAEETKRFILETLISARPTHDFNVVPAGFRARKQPRISREQRVARRAVRLQDFAGSNSPPTGQNR